MCGHKRNAALGKGTPQPLECYEESRFSRICAYCSGPATFGHSLGWNARRHLPPTWTTESRWATAASVIACCHLFASNPLGRMISLQWSSRSILFSGNVAGHFLGNWTNGRRHDHATHGQRLRIYRHRKWQGPVFSLVKSRRSELRRTPRRTASVIHRRTWRERAMCRKRKTGLTELRRIMV